MSASRIPICEDCLGSFEPISEPMCQICGRPFTYPITAQTVAPLCRLLVLSRTERWSSVRGAYATREGVEVDNLRVLLVDDVLTTGATLDACSRALKKAGAAEVLAMTVGRVVSSRSQLAPAQGRPTDSGEGNQREAKIILKS